MTRPEFIEWLKKQGLTGNYIGRDQVMVVDGPDVYKKLRHSFVILALDFKVEIKEHKKKIPPVVLTKMKGKIVCLDR